jgi:hypothetical protein
MTSLRYSGTKKQKILKTNIEKVRMGDIHTQGFENPMIDHISSGSWLGTLFIVCFTIAGILALLTAIICARNYLLARGWIGTQIKQPHCIRDFNVEYHNNRDFSDNEEDELSRIVRRTSASRAGTQSTVTSKETPPPFIHLVTPSAPEL